MARHDIRPKYQKTKNTINHKKKLFLQNISFQLEEKKAEDENSFSSLPILPNPEPSPPVLPNPDLLYSKPQEVKNKATSEHQRLFDEEEARDSSVSSIQVFNPPPLRHLVLQ